MIEELERFEAETSTGNRYTVIHRQHLTGHRPLAGGESFIPGSDDWITSCGIDLQPLSDGSFEMIQVDGILHRVG